tara:strand:+ start:1677 stop:2447 length:771 start_codon:yes stop_codon:yes gene_type:complete
MLRPRIIPILLLDGRALVKTRKFKKWKYIGDAINAVKIFNDKCADELILLDIYATKEKRSPNYSLIEEIISEAFMPVCYGGGISSFKSAENLFNLGIEKISIRTQIFENEHFIKELASHFGSSSIVASVDIQRSLFGFNLHISEKKIFFKNLNKIKDKLKKLQDLGSGELLVQVINRDGMQTGLDIILGQEIAKDLTIPVVLSGGTDSLDNISIALSSGISAIGVGAKFVLHGPHNAVLVSYPSETEFERLQKSII